MEINNYFTTISASLLSITRKQYCQRKQHWLSLSKFPFQQLQVESTICMSSIKICMQVISNHLSSHSYKQFLIFRVTKHMQVPTSWSLQLIQGNSSQAVNPLHLFFTSTVWSTSCSGLIVCHLWAWDRRTIAVTWCSRYTPVVYRMFLVMQD